VTFTHDAVRSWMERFAAEVAENRSYLTKLDGAIGDGDHGTNMDRGMKKAL
jgi:dihydroxyacetone kinase-like protein